MELSSGGYIEEENDLLPLGAEDGIDDLNDVTFADDLPAEEFSFATHDEFSKEIEELRRSKVSSSEKSPSQAKPFRGDDDDEVLGERFAFQQKGGLIGLGDHDPFGTGSPTSTLAQPSDLSTFSIFASPPPSAEKRRSKEDSPLVSTSTGSPASQLFGSSHWASTSLGPFNLSSPIGTSPAAAATGSVSTPPLGPRTSSHEHPTPAITPFKLASPAQPSTFSAAPGSHHHPGTHHHGLFVSPPNARATTTSSIFSSTTAQQITPQVLSFTDVTLVDPQPTKPGANLSLNGNNRSGVGSGSGGGGGVLPTPSAVLSVDQLEAQFATKASVTSTSEVVVQNAHLFSQQQVRHQTSGHSPSPSSFPSGGQPQFSQQHFQRTPAAGGVGGGGSQPPPHFMQPQRLPFNSYEMLDPQHHPFLWKVPTDGSFLMTYEELVLVVGLQTAPLVAAMNSYKDDYYAFVSAARKSGRPPVLPPNMSIFSNQRGAGPDFFAGSRVFARPPPQSMSAPRLIVQISTAETVNAVHTQIQQDAISSETSLDGRTSDLLNLQTAKYDVQNPYGVDYILEDGMTMLLQISDLDLCINHYSSTAAAEVAMKREALCLKVLQLMRLDTRILDKSAITVADHPLIRVASRKKGLKFLSRAFNLLREPHLAVLVDVCGIFLKELLTASASPEIPAETVAAFFASYHKAVTRLSPMSLTYCFSSIIRLSPPTDLVYAISSQHGSPLLQVYLLKGHEYSQMGPMPGWIEMCNLVCDITVRSIRPLAASAQSQDELTRIFGFFTALSMCTDPVRGSALTSELRLIAATRAAQDAAMTMHSSLPQTLVPS